MTAGDRVRVAAGWVALVTVLGGLGAVGADKIVLVAGGGDERVPAPQRRRRSW